MSGEHVDHEKLQRLHDGELSTAEARRVRSHLADCSSCAGYLRSLGRMEAGLRRMRRIRAPAGFVDQVLRRIRRSEGSRGDFAGWVTVAGLGLAAMGVMVLGLTARDWLAGSPDTTGFFSLVLSLLTMSPLELAGSLGSLGSLSEWWQGLMAAGATALPLALGLIGLGASIEVMRLAGEAGRRPIPADK